MNREQQFYPNPGFIPCGLGDEILFYCEEFTNYKTATACKAFVLAWSPLSWNSVWWKPLDPLKFMDMPRQNPLPIGTFVELSNGMVALCQLVNWKVVSNFGGKYRIRG